MHEFINSRFAMNGRRPELLRLDAQLGAVYRWARKLTVVRDALVSALPTEEAPHLLGVSLGTERLIVFADSATWCTRLRYRMPALQAAAEPFLGSRPRLEFHTLPAVSRTPPSRSAVLSVSAAATLRSAARTIADPGLAAALERLADAQPTAAPHAGPA